MARFKAIGLPTYVILRPNLSAATRVKRSDSNNRRSGDQEDFFFLKKFF